MKTFPKNRFQNWAIFAFALFAPLVALVFFPFAISPTSFGFLILPYFLIVGLFFGIRNVDKMEKILRYDRKQQLTDRISKMTYAKLTMSNIFMILLMILTHAFFWAAAFAIPTGQFHFFYEIMMIIPYYLFVGMPILPIYIIIFALVMAYFYARSRQNFLRLEPKV